MAANTAGVKYSFHLVGKHSDPHYHRIRTALQWLANTQPNVDCTLEAYFETQFENRIAQVRREFTGTSLEQASTARALVWCDVTEEFGKKTVLNFKTIEILDGFLSRTFDYRDGTRLVFYKRMGTKALRAAHEASGRKHYTLVFQEEGGPRERVIVELFHRTHPQKVAQFTKLADAGAYANTHVHRVKSNAYVQLGDLSIDGSGLYDGHSELAPYLLPDENLSMSHDRAGLLSAVHRGAANTVGTQFTITCAPITGMDGRNGIFGRVVLGMRCVRRMSKAKTNHCGRPIAPIKLVDAWEGTEVARPDDAGRAAPDAGATTDAEKHGPPARCPEELACAHKPVAEAPTTEAPPAEAPAADAPAADTESPAEVDTKAATEAAEQKDTAEDRGAAAAEAAAAVADEAAKAEGGQEIDAPAAQEGIDIENTAETNHAATKVQSLYRGRKARRHVEEKKKIKYESKDDLA